MDILLKTRMACGEAKASGQRCARRRGVLWYYQSEEQTLLCAAFGVAPSPQQSVILTWAFSDRCWKGRFNQLRQTPNSSYLSMSPWFQYPSGTRALPGGMHIHSVNSQTMLAHSNRLNAVIRFLMITVQITLGRSNSVGGSHQLVAPTAVRWL